MYEVYYRVNLMTGSLTEILMTKEDVLAFVAELLKEGIDLIQIRSLDNDNL